MGIVILHAHFITYFYVKTVVTKIMGQTLW